MLNFGKVPNYIGIIPASSKWPFDSPNGGHVFSPEKVTMDPNEVTVKNLVIIHHKDTYEPTRILMECQPGVFESCSNGWSSIWSCIKLLYFLTWKCFFFKVENYMWKLGGSNLKYQLHGMFYFFKVKKRSTLHFLIGALGMWFNFQVELRYYVDFFWGGDLPDGPSRMLARRRRLMGGEPKVYLATWMIMDLGNL